MRRPPHAGLVDLPPNLRVAERAVLPLRLMRVEAGGIDGKVEKLQQAPARRLRAAVTASYWTSCIASGRCSRQYAISR